MSFSGGWLKIYADFLGLRLGGEFIPSLRGTEHAEITTCEKFARGGRALPGLLRFTPSDLGNHFRRHTARKAKKRPVAAGPCPVFYVLRLLTSETISEVMQEVKKPPRAAPKKRGTPSGAPRNCNGQRERGKSLRIAILASFCQSSPLSSTLL